MAGCTRVQLFSAAEQAMDRSEQRMKKKGKDCWVKCLFLSCALLTTFSLIHPYLIVSVG
jgi:hypothetical protein